jgi:hypothetical protein
MKEITKRHWDYTLYEIDNQYILTVVFFAQIDYPRSFNLTREEANQNLAELSERIRNNYEEYQDREVKPPVTKPTIIS